MTYEQVIEKTGKPLAHWRKVLGAFVAKEKKSNDVVVYLQKEYGVTRYWARTLPTWFLKQNRLHHTEIQCGTDMEDTRKLNCDAHGEGYPVFVCRHLVHGVGLFYYEPNRQPLSEDESDDQCAWCERCEQIRLKFNGWVDESEALAGIQMICNKCFEVIRSKNRPGL